MLARRYLTSVKNLPAIMAKIIEGTAPKKFTTAHLKGIGFKSSNDQGILPVLKELGFLSDDGTPTQRYHDYRDQSRSRAVMGNALREAYEEIFHINERPSENDRAAIEGKFKSEHNVSDSVAQRQAMTFLALLQHADLDAQDPVSSFEKVQNGKEDDEAVSSVRAKQTAQEKRPSPDVSLRYNIEIHLPATKDIEVYNAIFKSLRAHVLDD